ncbi:MAG: laccase domain-containing protein, partial [Patescibacteria group bacterium]
MAIEMKSLFGGKVKYFFTGVSYGDCRPPTLQCPVSDNTARLVQLADHLGANEVFIPTPGATHCVVGTNDHGLYMFGSRIIRTRDQADAMVVGSLDCAVGITPADCHVVVIIDPTSLKWALVHIGHGGLIPQGGSPSILHQVVREMDVPVPKLQAHIFAGIRNCCNGYCAGNSQLISIKSAYPGLLNGKVVSKGPRMGQVAVDNLLIAQTDLS